MSPSVMDVAKYVLERQGRMSTMKLQKLVFYSAAYCAAWYDRRMFDERIEAWVNGPVVRELFKKHQGEFSVDVADQTEGDSSRLTRQDKAVVDAVLAGLGGLSGIELRERTHREDPWKKAFDSSARFPNDEITYDAIRSYYLNRT